MAQMPTIVVRRTPKAETGWRYQASYYGFEGHAVGGNTGDMATLRLKQRYPDMPSLLQKAGDDLIMQDNRRKKMNGKGKAGPPIPQRKQKQNNFMPTLWVLPTLWAITAVLIVAFTLHGGKWL